MSKKNILFLIPSLVGGGAERTLVNLLQRVDYNNYNIDLCVVSYNGTYKDQIPSAVVVLPLFNWDFLVRVLAYVQKKYGIDWIFKRRIQKVLTKKYDNAISFLDSNFTDLLFFLKAEKRVSWVHSSYKSYSNFAKFYENKAYRNKLILKRYSALDAIVFVSQDSKDEFIEVFGTFKIMPVVYNIIGANMVIQKSKEFEPERTDVLEFLAIGSLIPVKGFDLLIRSAAKVKASGHLFKLTILGQGFLLDDLTKLRNELGLIEEVELAGFKSNPYPYLKNTDVFIMSSVSEALPTVLCEAMILGKPVIVTNCSGCREVVNFGEFGIMAEQNEESLASSMLAMIKDDVKRNHFKEQSIQRAKIFDEQVSLGKYYEIMDM